MILVCDKQTQDTFQLSRMTGVRLWEAITLHADTVVEDRRTS